ncbi:FAD-linked oxidase C-terminal domain-containing protein, partial [Acinetobacter baumannii]
VTLDPTAVELVDRTMIDLARAIPQFRGTIERAIRGNPEAVLLVEFAGEARDPLLRQLDRLEELLADLGHPDCVVRAVEPALQAEIGEVRKA